MNEPTKKDWCQLANNAASWINDAMVEIVGTLCRISQEQKDLKNAIDWNWEVFNDADGQPKAVYWDDATEEERDMLDYFAKFDHVQCKVLKKLRQAMILVGECKDIMKEITNLE